jgi:hypothetical protein
MPEMKNRRKRSFVDPTVQGGLVLRIAIYWVVFMIDVALALASWWLLASPARDFNPSLREMWCVYAPVLVVSLLLLPLAILDTIRFSNRFVGPLVRLRRSMRQLACGNHVAPITFRRTEFWQDLADDFNAVLERVQGPQAAEDHESATEKEDLAARA